MHKNIEKQIFQWSAIFNIGFYLKKYQIFEEKSGLQFESFWVFFQRLLKRIGLKPNHERKE